MLVNICMSGGRTSAYMTEMALKHFSEFDFVITFANTGLEHEKTLEFVNNCDKRWNKLYGAKVIWLEAMVHHSYNLPSSAKVVSFETASRDGEPMREVVKKYGLPNSQFLHCTRELKENPILDYMKTCHGQTVGHTKNKQFVSASYKTWIGIREDEPKRLNGRRDGKQFKVFPLAEPFEKHGFDISCDKQDVLDFWSKMPFDLELPEHLGNCVDCHKKSDKKLKMVYQDLGEKAFLNSVYLDNQYSKVKAQELDGEIVERKRFRGYRNTKELIASFDLGDELKSELNGCETSCEPFMDSNEPEQIDFIDHHKTWSELDLMGENEQTV